MLANKSTEHGNREFIGSFDQLEQAIYRVRYRLTALSRYTNHIYFYQELVGGDEEKKDWWGISLSILTVILIGVLVGLSVVILTPAEVLYGPPLNYTEAMNIEGTFEASNATKRQWKDGRLVMMTPNKELGTTNPTKDNLIISST